MATDINPRDATVIAAAVAEILMPELDKRLDARFVELDKTLDARFVAFEEKMDKKLSTHLAAFERRLINDVRKTVNEVMTAHFTHSAA